MLSTCIFRKINTAKRVPSARISFVLEVRKNFELNVYCCNSAGMSEDSTVREQEAAE